MSGPDVNPGGVVLTLLLFACAARQAPAPDAPVLATMNVGCTILSINDTYRIESNADGTGGMARVRTLREQLEAEGDVLLLHAGDFLYPSLMSRTTKGTHMVQVLGALDGDVAAQDRRMWVVFGNHEFDAGKQKDAASLATNIALSQFKWLGTNVNFTPGTEGTPAPFDVDPVRRNLVKRDLVSCGGLDIGLFGITTDKKSAEYLSGFDDPVTTARDSAKALRERGADVVVAVTHQSVEQDAAMLRALGAEGPDLVIGGHEHEQRRELVEGRPIYKADADARSAWTVKLMPSAEGVVRTDQLVKLTADIPEDPYVQVLVAALVQAHDTEFCGAKKEPAGCLAAEVGSTTVPLVAAELDIRRFETNLGDWVADRARAAYPDAQIALINAGSLRLNRDLAPGPLRRQDIEELFAYPMPLVRIEIDGATLEQVVARAVQEWTGNGHWLQISGFAWAHDPAAGTGTRLTLLSTGKRVQPTDKLVAVVPAYLVDPSTDRDGYTMLPVPKDLTGPDLKQLVLDALAAEKAGISPTVEGRVCNPQRPGPCLAAP